MDNTAAIVTGTQAATACPRVRVVGLVGSPEKKEIVKSLGADQVFTYDEFYGGGKLPRGAVVENGGFSLILDARGGKALKDSLRRLAPAGRVVRQFRS